jgi:5-methyltetrahydropteroyltriglutamate--homocysteine methyltransferase
VGAIDVASQQVETPEQVAATLREAMQYIDAEQILACTNCGLAPLPMDISRAKIQALGAGARLLRAELAG